jgi:mannose-6-phosphate isomerase
VLLHGRGFQVKRLIVKPGHRLSLQYHHHRSEHWNIVEGAGRFRIGRRTLKAAAGQSVYVPKGAVHRIENPGRCRLVIVEVQMGSHIHESDIVRLKDDYSRG